MSLYDPRIWAWDLSRPLGEFPNLLGSIENLFANGWRQAEVPMMRRSLVAFTSTLSELEKDYLQSGAVVTTIRIRQTKRPHDQMLCAAFCTEQDQQAFGDIWFS